MYTVVLYNCIVQLPDRYLSVWSIEKVLCLDSQYCSAHRSVTCIPPT